MPKRLTKGQRLIVLVGLDNGNSLPISAFLPERCVGALCELLNIPYDQWPHDGKNPSGAALPLPAFTTGLPRCEPMCEEASLEAWGSDGFLRDIGARICTKCRAVWPKHDPEYPWPQCDACNGKGPCSVCGRTAASAW